MREKVAARLLRFKQNRVIVALWDFFTPARENPFPLQVLFTILYRLALDTVYVWTLSPVFGYAGFTTTILPLRYLMSLLAVVAFAPFVAKLLNDKDPSSVLVSFLNYLYFIPLTSYFGCRGGGGAFFFIGLLYWGILLFLELKIPKLALKPLSGQSVHISMIILTIGAVAFVLAVSGTYTSFRFTLDFINVYEIRAEAATYQMPMVVSYLQGMMPIVLAVLLIYWLKRKNVLAVAMLVVTYLFLFSIAALKSTFLFLFLVLASVLFYREWMLRWMSGLMFLVCSAAFVERALGGIYFLSLFFRRMMYVPVQLSEKYAAFFEENPLNLFQHGIMGKLSFDPLYSEGIPRIIGEYMAQYWTNANNGLVGDMVANLPIVLGLLLMPLVLIVCFRLLDLAVSKTEVRVWMPFCVYYAISFINASWSTVLLSHGFLMTCLLLYIFPKEETFSK